MVEDRHVMCACGCGDRIEEGETCFQVTSEDEDEFAIKAGEEHTRRFKEKYGIDELAGVNSPLTWADEAEVAAKVNGDRAVGYWVVSNSYSLVVVEIVHGIEDQAVIGWSDEERTRARRILYTQGGRSYINFNKRRWYMDECMRVEGKRG